MSILIETVRVSGLRGLQNIEVKLVYRFQINITMIQSHQAFHPSYTST